MNRILAEIIRTNPEMINIWTLWNDDWFSSNVRFYSLFRRGWHLGGAIL